MAGMCHGRMAIPLVTGHPPNTVGKFSSISRPGVSSQATGSGTRTEWGQSCFGPLQSFLQAPSSDLASKRLVNTRIAERSQFDAFASVMWSKEVDMCL